MTDEGSHSFLATVGSDLDVLAFEEESRKKGWFGEARGFAASGHLSTVVEST